MAVGHCQDDNNGLEVRQAILSFVNLDFFRPIPDDA
jgi:hypothetical protein